MTIIKWAIKRFLENRGAEAASSISYYALFSLFPFLLFLAASASYVLEQEGIQQQILEYISEVFPFSQDAIISQIETVLAARGAVGLFALITFLWSASGVFNTLTAHINRAWFRSNTRGILHQRLIALGIIAGLVGLTYGSLIATTFFNLLPISKLIIWEKPTSWETFSSLSSQVVPLLIRLIIFYLLYRIVPATRVKGMAAFWGALVAALAWELVTDAFTWVLSSGLVHYELVYGSLGAIIALLFWIYMISWILLFGAYLTAAIDESKEQHIRETNS
ncbi:MAG: YihY/virulence factor BrkB family protein [Anaerolineales bacterium]|nr:YihY/virulence factor BrkB family protein [Anaerolineales bacterium]